MLACPVQGSTSTGNKQQIKESRAQIGCRTHSHPSGGFEPIQSALGHEAAAALNAGARREVTFDDF